MKSKLESGQRYLAIWIFVVFTIPLARFPLGSIPIYLIDIITIIGILSRKPVTKNNWYTTLIAGFLFFSFISGLFEAVYFNTYLSPIYMFLRYGLGIISFFVVQAYLLNYALLMTVLKTVVVVLLFNAIIAILYSNPLTGDFVEQYAFGNKFLFPQRSGIATDLLAEREEGFRARSLVGGTNILAFVLLMGLGVSFYLVQERGLVTRKWRFLVFIALALGLIGLGFTFSRQAYLGLVVMVGLTIYIKGKRRIKVIAMFTVLIVAVVILSVDLTSSSFSESKRITESVEILQGEREISRGETARILAYQLPFKLLFERPEFWFRGRGLSNTKLSVYDGISSDAYLYQIKSGESHSVIASTIFDRGGFAALSLILLIFIIGKKVFQTSNINASIDLNILCRNIFIALMPGILFAHYFIDARQGAYMLFITLGLLYKLNQFKSSNG